MSSPALMFFPRGGSAHVARALAAELPAHGWDVTLVAGLARPATATPAPSTPGSTSHAVDFDAGDAPMHPSYEDRPGADDPVFAAVDDAAFERHVAGVGRARWRRPAPPTHDVLHLHHLTPHARGGARASRPTCRSSPTCTAPSC